jgi:hypothetical protein
MNWKKRKPSVEGWYWVRNSPKEDVPALIYHDSDEHWWIHEHGQKPTRLRDFTIHAQFMGPISPGKDQPVLMTPVDKDICDIYCHSCEAKISNTMARARRKGWCIDLEIRVVLCPSCRDRKCRVCGCSWFNACPGGCSWVEPDLCSQCVPKGAKK